MESGSDDDFQSVVGDVPPSPSGSDRSGSSRVLASGRAGSWGGMLSPMERVRNAEQVCCGQLISYRPAGARPYAIKQLLGAKQHVHTLLNALSWLLIQRN